MPMNVSEPRPDATRQSTTVLELLVRNHPGVMSHVCGLFSRRAYNLEGIAVLPVGDGRLSKIWLKIDGQGRLEQIIKQLTKLNDVMDVKRHESSHSLFSEIKGHFQLEMGAAAVARPPGSVKVSG